MIKAACWIFLFCSWMIIGILVLVGDEIRKRSYFLVWFSLLVFLAYIIADILMPGKG